VSDGTIFAPGLARATGREHTEPGHGTEPGLRALDPARLGLWFFLATVTMLFAAFSSAYLVRRSTEGWGAIDLPRVLWVNTTVILLSSLTLERARAGASRWLAATYLLGLLFLAGQGAAWRGLQDAGVLLPDSPHAAFLYIFTALHGAHLVAGLSWIAILWWASRARNDRSRRTEDAALEDRIGRCATYWHFMAGLWVFLFAVLHLR
jgi:cytochrome c oxidase subunit 3